MQYVLDPELWIVPMSVELSFFFDTFWEDRVKSVANHTSEKLVIKTQYFE